MGGRERGHGAEGGGLLIGVGGWVVLLQGGVVGGAAGAVGRSVGAVGRAVGAGLSHDVTGHVGRNGVGGYPRGWALRWLPWRKGRGLWCGARGFPCESQRAGC